MPRPPKPFLALLLGVLATMALVWLSPLRELEYGTGLNLLYDFRGTRPAPDAVRIITLDSRSALALGQSPHPERWPRELHAQLVAGLAARGAAVIGFDVLFEHARDAAGDAALARAFRAAGNVVLVEGLARDELGSSGGASSPASPPLAIIDKLTPPLPLLHAAAWASGPFVMPKTPEGVSEFWPFVPSLGDAPSLPVLMARRLAAAGREPPALQARLEAHPRRQLLNLYGPLGSIPTIPYHQALAQLADPRAGAAAFGGKAVLVGFSEFNQSRQADVFRTSFSSADGLDLSGVELAATALANLLEDSALSRPPEALMGAALLAWSLLLALPWGFVGTRRALALDLGLALLWATGAAWAFGARNLWLPLILPALIAPLAAIAGGAALHLRAARRREHALERALGLSQAARERIEKLLGGHPDGRPIHGVCLSSDIEGYTPLAERLGPAATLAALNRYWVRYEAVVAAHGGHLMDNVGDSALCLWLAEDSAAAACRQASAAALELQQLMDGGGGAAEGALPTRFGLHYGQLYLGAVGHGQHRELRAVGDIVNTASRIQSVNKQLGTRLLASAAVIDEGCGGGHPRALGAFVLAGKRHPLALHEIRAAALPAALGRRFDDARAAYAAGRPEAAIPLLQDFLAACPDDGPARFYLQRSLARQAGAGLPDGDGCVVLDSK